MTAALRPPACRSNGARSKANNDVTLALPEGVRHALIGPNGAGKTTLINLLTGALAPTSGDVYLEGERITGLAQHERVKRGMTRTFQINTLFAGLTVLESATLTVCERKGRAGIWHRTVARQRDEANEALALLATLGLAAEAQRADAQPALRQAAAGRNRAGARDQATHPAARRAGGRHSGRRERRTVRGDRRAAEGRDDPVHRARHGARVPVSPSASPCSSAAAC